MSTAAAVSSPLTNSPADILTWQEEQVRNGNYDLLGRVWMIVLEVAQGSPGPAPAVANVLGSRLEFYGYDGRNGNNLMPRIATTRDKQSLLLLDPIRRQDGTVGMPDIPDPTWTPAIPTADEIAWDPSKHPKGTKAPEYKPGTAPMLRQDLGQRARGQLRNSPFLVFGPVAQILVRPEGIPDGWILQCGGELRSGLTMDLLIDQTSGRAFFFGGRFQITRPNGA